MTGSHPFRLRQFRLLAFYAVCSLPFITYGAFQSLQTNSNSPIDWVPASFPPRAVYDDSIAKFGPGDVVVASWDGCTIDEARLDELQETLQTETRFLASADRSYFERVSTGREVFLQLTNGPRPISREQAVQRLQGTFIGPDGLQTCLVVTFTADGLKERSWLVGAIQQRIEEICGVLPDAQHLAGPIIDGMSVDQAGRTSLDRLALPSAALVLVLACLCLRSIRAGAIVFGLSAFCQGATLALIHYTGESMSALLIVLPPLIQVLAVAGGVHLTNYYFDSMAEHGPREAPWEAVRLGWAPCVLASGTTALGIGSLISSELSPIRSFGVYATAGVLLTSALLLLMVPAIWTKWPLGARRSADHLQSDSAIGNRTWANRMTVAMTRGWPGVLVVTLVLSLAFGNQLQNLQTSVRIETLFSDDSRILQDYHWIEERVAPLVPIDLIVSWPVDSESPLTDRLKSLWDIQRAAAESPDVGGSISAVQLFPALPTRSEVPSQFYDQAMEVLLANSRAGFIDSRFLVEQEGREYWRITSRLSALADVNYSHFLEQIRKNVSAAVHSATDADHIEVDYTGIMPLVHEVQRQLFLDLFHSFMGAIVLITVMMTLAQAGIAAGLIAMIPNVVPIVVLFGILGWRGIPLDIGTVMTASVALGISVDDTLHFLTFVQRRLQTGRSRTEAVEFAYRHCGMAMIQTSIICGFGLMVFGLAEFVPTSRFAWMTSALIAAALLADLLLLPALLLSPLGVFFETSPGKHPPDSDPPENV